MWADDVKILVADDNEDAAVSLAMLFELEGFDVRTEYNGAAAFGAFKADHPAVMCLDIGMPELNGYEVAEKVRGAEQGEEHALLIAISAYGTARDRAKSATAGFDHHMVKPPDFERLKRWIDAFVAGQTDEEATDTPPLPTTG